ncbi:hypothetical protein VNO77_41830 [Canavalia gladiata]|uniref:Uncharacterized protein n=1 Tax=Canavalia gladiata TaxID=3824 RepID=A0AAN9K313_CANGL
MNRNTLEEGLIQRIARLQPSTPGIPKSILTTRGGERERLRLSEKDNAFRFRLEYVIDLGFLIERSINWGLRW